MIPEKIKQVLKNGCHFAFGNLSKIKTTFFSDTFIALGYFIKNETEFNRSIADFKKIDRYELHDYLSCTYISPKEKIHFLEFGVRWGHIISKWALNNKNQGSIFTGFDTFTGLPEDWGSVKKGSFSNEGDIPKTDDSRIGFRVGLVQDTLPGYVKDLQLTDRLIIHLDLDLYNATLFTLLVLQPILKTGDIIILDEYFSISKSHHEYRAFVDFLSLYKIQYKPLNKSRSGQYVIEISQ